MSKKSLINLTLIASIVLCGCSAKISKHFKETKYIRNYSIHIINDSLQLYFKSPADITYTTDRKKLKKTLREGKLHLKERVLVYGKTNEPPYEYFVTLTDNPKQSYAKELITFDTIINNQTFRFIGNPLAENSQKTLEIDLKRIFKSLEVGKNYRKEISTVMDIVDKHKNSNKYLAVLNEISEFPTYDKQEEWTQLQMELTYASFLGENELYDNYLNQLESKFKPNDTISKIINETSKTESNALATIVNEAKKHKILMINENHFYPNHRFLVSDLLLKLKDIGYNYLALEALSEAQDRLLNMENSYPTLETGFYTHEQNYSNLIRKAKALGFEFVAYENRDNDKSREVGQAQTLFNKTFKIDSTAKVIVLGGIDHILEKPTKSGKKWMATIFKEKYNMDPLTISQTHLNSYRNQIEGEYHIISSDLFNNDRLNSIDFLILNNKKKEIAENTFTYKNETDNDVQVALFYGSEIIDRYDYTKKTPYFSKLLKSGKTYDLPIRHSGEIYLYAFDKNGKRVDKHIIQSANTLGN